VVSFLPIGIGLQAPLKKTAAASRTGHVTRKKVWNGSEKTIKKIDTELTIAAQ